MNFYGGRFTLLPANQNIFYGLGSERKFGLIMDALSKEAEFETHGLTVIIEPITDTQGTLVGGKIGRHAVRTLSKRPHGKMVKIPEDLYPHVLFLLIPEEQIILIQRDRGVFSSDIQVFHYFEHFFKEQLFLKGLEVSIKPLTVKGQFWDVIETSDKVYSVRFKLEMPNFLGDTEAGLRDTLDLPPQSVPRELRENPFMRRYVHRLKLLKLQHIQPVFYYPESCGAG